jgi:hypothetical protein
MLVTCIILTGPTNLAGHEADGEVHPGFDVLFGGRVWLLGYSLVAQKLTNGRAHV